MADLQQKVTYLPDVHRLLPQSSDAERALLGAILLLPDEVMGLCLNRGITKGHFHIPAHALIYELVEEMWRELDITLDLITVTQKLIDRCQLDQVGGAAFVAELFNFVPTAANAAFYIGIIREKYILRKLIVTCTEIAARSYDEQDNLEAIINTTERGLLSIAGAWRGSKPRQTTSETALEILRKFQASDTTELFGVSTGFPSLDEEIGGLCKGDLIVIAGPSSSGKSALALNISHAFSKRGERVGYFTFEMTRQQQVTRLIQMQGGENLRNAIRNGDLLNPEPTKNVERGAREVMDSLIEFVDDKGLDIRGCVSEARRMHAEKPLGLAVLDYDELIRGERAKGDSYEQELASIARNWKHLAGELGIPAILLSQVTLDDKGAEKMRHSGAKVNYANVLLLIKNGETKNHVASKTVVVRKQRDGRRGEEIEFDFDEAITRFREKRY